MDKIDIKQISREEAAWLIAKRKLEILGELEKKDILMHFAELYGRYLAICSDESMDREINSLGV